MHLVTHGLRITFNYAQWASIWAARIACCPMGPSPPFRFHSGCSLTRGQTSHWALWLSRNVKSHQMGAVVAERFAVDGLCRRPLTLDHPKQFHGQQQASPESAKEDNRTFAVSRER